jgi:lipopolysaccharide transport system permease protein
MQFKQLLNLVLYKAYAELRTEAERTYAGFLWWVLEPIFSMLVYYVVFAYFFGQDFEDGGIQGRENYVSFLCIGVVTWQWMQNTVMRASNTILLGRELMQQVYLPKVVFPAAAVLADCAKFTVVFVLLLTFILLQGAEVSRAYLALPLLLVIQVTFITGLTFVMAAIMPFFPDLRLLILHVLHLGFFVSGVFFDIADLPPRLQILFRLNPMANLLEAYRAVLLHSQWPRWDLLVAIFLSSAVLVAAGGWLIHRLDRVFPKVC